MQKYFSDLGKNNCVNTEIKIKEKHFIKCETDPKQQQKTVALKIKYNNNKITTAWPAIFKKVAWINQQGTRKLKPNTEIHHP